jgi:pyruvate dehydrogenase E1 component
LLDNLGSIVGVRQESCAVRKHSKCGRPEEIYAFHGIDADSIVEAAGKVLAETALEETVVPGRQLEDAVNSQGARIQNWSELWPASRTTKH